ncbi:MAG: peptidoglycan DD-metalloendopeptidase family protein [Clostridia bacterium]|nr:peptidoglycan DD-metalloendopeptidase family protein [Clostridia bacterium]
MDKRKLTKGKIRAKVTLWSVALVMVAAVMLTPFAKAATIDDWQNQLNNKNKQKEQIQEELNQSKKDLEAAEKELNALDQKIYQAGVELNQLTGELNETKAEIVKGLEELEQLKKDIEKQNDDLNARLRSMYKNGDVGMLSVVFGSSSMSDVLTNMDMVQRIYNADAELLKSIQEQYDLVDAQNRKLEALKVQLEEQQAVIAEKKSALEADEAEARARRNALQADADSLQKQYDAVKKEADSISETIKVLQSQNTQYIGGAMCWPSQASTRITSPFGWRYLSLLGGRNYHTGVDIGAAGGTNILAANSGKVIKAGWNNSYGYMVMVDHGGGIVTLYAHSSKLLVKTGDVVTRGQAIALIGSTGMSTGNHLHFEVRVNGKYQNPLNYITPSVRN